MVYVSIGHMPAWTWPKIEFGYGHDSGNIPPFVPGRVIFSEDRRREESYRRVFKKALLLYLRLNSRVLELGPWKGSWPQAILKFVPQEFPHSVAGSIIAGYFYRREDRWC